jgi:tetratricopeptide (TPR) repeat protein
MSSLQFASSTHAASLSLNDLVRSAEELQTSGKLNEAVNLYRQWLSHSRETEKFVARFHYGWLLQKLNQFEDAQAVQNEFIEDYARHLAGGVTALH